MRVPALCWGSALSAAAAAAADMGSLVDELPVAATAGAAMVNSAAPSARQVLTLSRRMRDPCADTVMASPLCPGTLAPASNDTRYRQ